MNVAIREKQFTLAADGGTDGYCNVTANTGAYPGAIGFLTKADRSLQQRLVCTDLNGADKIGVRFLPEGLDDSRMGSTVRYGWLGRSSAASFPSGSFLCFGSQVVEVDQPTFTARPAANL